MMSIGEKARGGIQEWNNLDGYDEEQFISEAYEVDFDPFMSEQIEKYVTEFTQIREDNDAEEGVQYNSTHA